MGLLPPTRGAEAEWPSFGRVGGGKDMLVRSQAGLGDACSGLRCKILLRVAKLLRNRSEAERRELARGGVARGSLQNFYRLTPA